MLHKRSIKEKILKGGAWAFAGKIVTAFTGLALSALLARLLTPDELGAYFLTFSLVSAAAIVAQLGLTQTIVRVVAESMGTNRPSRARKSVILALRMAAIGGLIVAIIIACGAGQWVSEKLFNSEAMSQVMSLAALWVVIITFQQLIAEIYRGFHDIRLATLFGGLVSSVICMGLFFVLWVQQGHGDLQQIIYLTVGAGAISVMISSAILWNKLGKLAQSEIDDIKISELINIAWPILLTNLTIFILIQADIWIVGYFIDEESVAIYGVGARLAALILVTSTILHAFFAPIIAEMDLHNDLNRLEKILSSSAFGNSVVVLPIFSFFLFFSESALNFVYGEYYGQAADVLLLLSVGLYFNVVTGIRGLVLMMTGREKVQMVVSIVGAGSNIIFCSIGAITHGVVGAAAGAMAGMVLQCIMELLATKRYVGIWTYSSLPNFIALISGSFKKEDGIP